METRQQRLIRQALEQGSETGNRPGAGGGDAADVPQAPPETSLREQSFQHTDPDYVPRTLTPHEWEDYYRERGVPREHQRAGAGRRVEGQRGAVGTAQDGTNASGSLILRVLNRLGLARRH